MPRTKQRKVKQRTSNGHEQALRDFNRLVQLRIQKLEIDARGALKRLETSLEMALTRFPAEIQNMTLRELLTYQDSPKKENLPPKTPRAALASSKKSLAKSMSKSSIAKSRTTATSDDGYQSESLASQGSKAGGGGTKRRSRSCSQGGKSQGRARSVSREKRSRIQPATAKKDVLKTPNNKPTTTAASFTITPKIKLNSAVNVLRKPKDGEMVFSTQGSPLLVSTTVSDRTANINVPLRNGNVVSLLPFNEIALSDNLHLDEETRHQLKILQSHLSKVLN